GTVLYFSIPFRLGLSPGALVVMNAVVAIASASCGALSLGALLGLSTPLARAAIALASFGAHAFFVGRSVGNSMSDLPSALAVMTSVWCFLLVGTKMRAWLYAASGLLLGFGIELRAFYLYPALLFVVVVAVLAAFRRIDRKHAALVLVLAAMPVAFQFAATHARTGAWAFIDPEEISEAREVHFNNAWYGYDTVLRQGLWGEAYRAMGCFRGTDVRTAMAEHDGVSLGCLWTWRQWFYLGSFVWTGQAYLRVAE